MTHKPLTAGRTPLDGFRSRSWSDQRPATPTLAGLWSDQTIYTWSVGIRLSDHQFLTGTPSEKMVGPSSAQPNRSKNDGQTITWATPLASFFWSDHQFSTPQAVSIWSDHHLSTPDPVLVRSDHHRESARSPSPDPLASRAAAHQMSSSASPRRAQVLLT